MGREFIRWCGWTCCQSHPAGILPVKDALLMICQCHGHFCFTREWVWGGGIHVECVDLCNHGQVTHWISLFKGRGKKALPRLLSHWWWHTWELELRPSPAPQVCCTSCCGFWMPPYPFAAEKVINLPASGAWPFSSRCTSRFHPVMSNLFSLCTPSLSLLKDSN